MAAATDSRLERLIRASEAAGKVVRGAKIDGKGTSIFERFRKCMAVCACEAQFGRPTKALTRLEVRGAAPYTLRFACVLA